MVGCGLTSATWLPLTMRLPPSTRPSGSRERRSFAFISENSGIAYRPRRIFSMTSRIVLEHRRCLRGDGSTRPPTFLRLWLPRARAVVDAEGRVHGAERLSVLDSPIMPDVPSGLTHLPTLMLIAERLSESR